MIFKNFNFGGIRMGKFLFKKVISVFTVFALLLGLISISGCSSITKEEEIFKDIKSQDTYCSTFDFTYDSMEVVKRMTDEEEKTDKVWVDFACHNDDFEYKVECIVNYTLYNEGWIFENYEILNSSYSALTKPSEKNVYNDFANLKLQTVEEWEQLDHGPEGTTKIVDPNKYEFIGYSQEIISEYFTWAISYSISYVFTPEEGWVGEKYHEDKLEIWNWDAFLGKWLINGWAIDKIGITSIDSQSITVDWYNEHLNGSVDTFTENFNMDYVTGTNEIIEYPDDIPVYKALLVFEEAYDHNEGIYFTPYGMYDFVCYDPNGNYQYGTHINGTYFGTKFEKIA